MGWTIRCAIGTACDPCTRIGMRSWRTRSLWRRVWRYVLPYLTLFGSLYRSLFICVIWQGAGELFRTTPESVRDYFNRVRPICPFVS